MTLNEQLHNSRTHGKGINPNCPVCNPLVKLTRTELNDAINIASLNLHGQLKPEAHEQLKEKYVALVAEKSRRNKSC